MIQFRRFAAFLVGVWLAGSICMDGTAVANFYAVDRFLADPGIGSAPIIHKAGVDDTRLLMRRVAGESNVWLFEQWEWIQLLTGFSLLLVFIFGNRPPKIPIGLCVLMMLVVVIERFVLTPNIVRLGRVVAFLPATPITPERAQFAMYHNAYSIADAVKILFCLAIAFILIVRRQPDPQMFARESEYADDPRATRQADR